jgi:transcriptional regulatory protein RtcR
MQLSPPRSKRSGNPDGDYQLIDLDLLRYDQIARRAAVERQEGASFLKSGINTRNEVFNQMTE